MQLITAPSKTQEFNGRLSDIFTLPHCIHTSEQINTRLRVMDKETLSQLMKTSPKLTESTYRRIHDFVTPFTLKNARQALFTFQGDAYEAIEAESYSEIQLEYAQNHLCILSGLYGILRPLDLMQPYRLEMAAKLEVKGCKNLYQLWQNEVTETLNSRFTRDHEQVVVNLASAEYSRVIDKKQLKAKIIEMVFRQEHKGRLKTIPIHSKKARGLMIHFAISNRIEKAADLKDFDLDGYSLNSEESTDLKWIFQKS
jgi:cytoplasmic iron level regulating protein YaaA (DUF328/UPF0246 family)